MTHEKNNYDFKESSFDGDHNTYNFGGTVFKTWNIIKKHPFLSIIIAVGLLLISFVIFWGFSSLISTISPSGGLQGIWELKSGNCMYKSFYFTDHGSRVIMGPNINGTYEVSGDILVLRTKDEALFYKIVDLNDDELTINFGASANCKYSRIE